MIPTNARLIVIAAIQIAVCLGWRWMGENWRDSLQRFRQWHGGGLLHVSETSLKQLGDFPGRLEAVIRLSST